MKINDIAHLELFAATFCDGVDTDAPAPAMPTPSDPTTLAEALGAGDRLIDNLASYYDATGQVRLAIVARRLSVALADEQLFAAGPQEARRGLTNYIYPVV